MTNHARAPTLRRVSHTIKLPSHLYARVVALGVDVNGFCCSAIELALDRRKTLTDKRPVGRPAPAVEKVRKTYNVDVDVAAKIADLAAADPSKSESAVVNRLLRASVLTDGS